MKVIEFDAAFEAGEEIVEYLDLRATTRPNQEIKRVNVEFPNEWQGHWTKSLADSV